MHLSGWLLRPGHYTLAVACDGATTKTGSTSAVTCRVDARIIDWGGSGKGPDQIKAGEDGAGVNLMFASYEGHDQDANIRGGIDYMRNCTMGRAHQMDARLKCDWSDPYVLAGGNARVARQALNDRRAPNTIGVHFYDEPGLTWNKHPRTGVFGPHNIASQDRAFQAAFGQEAMSYTDVRPDDPAALARWEDWLRWKQVFMESAWRLAQHSVNYVQPQYLTATQSMYGWMAFGDGYYFNIARPLPVMSGHGGYDDYASGYVNPGFFFEMGRARDFDKPVWYLPQWWEQVPADLFRLEQYLTFMMRAGAGGSARHQVRKHRLAAAGRRPARIEQAHARLGTIFTTMPVTRAETAVLYSMSQNTLANANSKDLQNVQDFAGQAERLLQLYIASKMAHIPLWPVVEEDILDGSLAAGHKAIVLAGIERLDERMVAAVRITSPPAAS